MDALEFLATNAGIEIPRNSNSINNEDFKIFDKINDLTVKFFQKNLSEQSESSSVYKYLKSRNIEGESSQNFSLGFATKSWDDLCKYLLKEGISREDILKTGLIKTSDKGKDYDFFRNRLMFPIRNRRGQVIGFGGRVIENEEPKYLNSAESLVFKKNRELYGLYESIEQNRNINKILVVEGYTDVIALFSGGFPYAMATLGIATSKYHLENILKITNEVVFCFDGDQAGSDAARRAVEVTLPFINDNRKFNILFLPEGQDPASIMEEHGTNKFEEYLSKSVVLSKYIQDSFLAGTDDSIETKANAMRSFQNFIKSIPPSNFKTLLVKDFSSKLGFKVDEEIQPAIKKKSFTMKENETIIESTILKKILAVVLDFPGRINLDLFSYFDVKSQTKEEETIAKIIEFCKSAPNYNAGQLIEEYPELKGDITSIAAGENIVSEAKANEYIEESINFYLKKENISNHVYLQKKHMDGDITEKEKIELKKSLLEKFEALDDQEKELLKSL
jgi:DNA primase